MATYSRPILCEEPAPYPPWGADWLPMVQPQALRATLTQPLCELPSQTGGAASAPQSPLAGLSVLRRLCSINPELLWSPPDSASALLPIEGVLARIGRIRIRISEGPAIKDYLSRYPELAPLVEATATRASEIFGAAAQLSLEIIQDRESEDRYTALMVRFEEYPEDVMETLESINRTFDDADPSSEGWFFVTTDFQNPR